MKKLLIILLFTKTILFASSYSFFSENDMVANTDRHYTSGLSFAYFSNNDTNSKENQNNKLYKFITEIPTLYDKTKYQKVGLNYSHHVFTPQDLKKTQKIEDDMPYAGLVTLDFILLKYSETFFHEYMLTIGAIGPITQTKKLQNGFHEVINTAKANGWDNQLSNDYLYNFTYAFGYKIYKKNFKSFDMDISNHIRMDVGKLSRNLQVGSNIRFGKNFYNSINSNGRLIGINESKYLNTKKENDNKNWAFSYGILYYHNDFFYVTDIDNSYTYPRSKNIISEIVSFDVYSKSMIFSITYKSSLLINSQKNVTNESWGGFNISYLF